MMIFSIQSLLSVFLIIGRYNPTKIDLGCFITVKSSDNWVSPLPSQQIVYGKRKNPPGWFSNILLVLHEKHHMLQSGVWGHRTIHHGRQKQQTWCDGTFCLLKLSAHSEAPAESAGLSPTARVLRGPLCLQHSLLLQPGAYWLLGWEEGEESALILRCLPWFESHTCTGLISAATLTQPIPFPTQDSVSSVVVNTR